MAFYIPGTTTQLATYQDQALSIANANPVVLDANGEALIWGFGAYRQIVQDSAGNTLWDEVRASDSGPRDRAYPVTRIAIQREAKLSTPDFAAQFRPRVVVTPEAMFCAWWWLALYPWTAPQSNHCNFCNSCPGRGVTK